MCFHFHRTSALSESLHHNSRYIYSKVPMKTKKSVMDMDCSHYRIWKKRVHCLKNSMSAHRGMKRCGMQDCTLHLGTTDACTENQQRLTQPQISNIPVHGEKCSLCTKWKCLIRLSSVDGWSKWSRSSFLKCSVSKLFHKHWVHKRAHKLKPKCHKERVYSKYFKRDDWWEDNSTVICH